MAQHAHALACSAQTDEERRLADTLVQHAQHDWGIVVMPVPGCGTVKPAVQPAATAGPDARQTEGTVASGGGTDEWPQGTLPALLKAFEVARSERSPVNIGPFSNHHVAAALHALAYGQTEQYDYRMRFQDASISQPLLLPRFAGFDPSQQTAEPARRLRVALLSHRHLALDHEVDANWFRNAETSSGDPHAVIEERCAEVTRSQLSGYQGAPLRIEMHQTGFLPAVVGFYRGLLDILPERRGSLEVRVEVMGRVLWWR